MWAFLVPKNNIKTYYKNIYKSKNKYDIPGFI